MVTIAVKRGSIALTSIAAVLAGLAGWLHPSGATAADDAAQAPQVALGKRLFADRALSRDGKVSCESCHQAEHAFTDAKPVSTGFEAKAGLRNAMSLLNVGAQPHFFWDGRRSRLEDQVLDPLVNPLEHAFSDQAAVLAFLRADPSYRAAFKQAFPDAGPEPIQTPQLALALASFVRTLVSPESAIDRYLVRKDTSALSADARAGLALFTGKAQCVSCHSLTPDPTTQRVLLTDQNFHAHNATFYSMHQMLDQSARQILAQGKPLNEVARTDPHGTDALGRFMVTGQLSDVGAFRTPSLRNVARTAPYFHDGAVATLELALEQELLGQGSEQIMLDPGEKRSLLALLRALNDDK